MDTAQTRRENEVWQACDDLWARGITIQKISLDALTARLLELGYKKGSPNQIYQYRKSWKESRGIDDNFFSEQPTTVALTDPISRAVALVREELQTEAEQKIAQIQEEATQKVYEAHENYEQLKSQLQEIVRRLEQKDHVINQAEKSNKELQTSLLEEQQAHKAAIIKAEMHEKFLLQNRQDTEKQVIELKNSYQDQVKLLTQQLDHLTKHYREEISELKNFTENQRHQGMFEKDRLQTLNQKLEKELTKTQSSEEANKFAYEELKRQYQSQINVLSVVRSENKQLVETNNHHVKIIAIKETDNKNLALRFEEKREESQRLQQQLFLLQEKIGRLEQLQQLSKAPEKTVNKIKQK